MTRHKRSAAGDGDERSVWGGIDEGNDAAAFGPRLVEDPEVTGELTGFDAPADEADSGSAGNGASFAGADLVGVPREEADREPAELESRWARPVDILPDRLVRGVSTPADDDREITAQPREDLRPITADLLPEG